MYTKEEASRIKETFWVTFGHVMKPQLSAEGEKVKWINYRTGIKHLYFRMDADHRAAVVKIEMAHPDLGIQELMFDQFKELEHMLNACLPEAWEWKKLEPNQHGNIVSTIGIVQEGVNVFNPEDGPKLFRFFSKRIKALDQFWCDAHYGFEMFK